MTRWPRPRWRQALRVKRIAGGDIGMRRWFAAGAIAVAVLSHGPVVARADARTRATTRTTATVPAPPANALTLSVGSAPSGTLATAALRPGSTTSLRLIATNGTTADRLEVTL